MGTLLDSLFDKIATAIVESQTENASVVTKSTTGMDLKTFVVTELNKKAKSDSKFAKAYSRTDKNIDGCLLYIYEQFKKICIRSGGTGFACSKSDGSDIIEYAMEYYVSDNVKAIQPKTAEPKKEEKPKAKKEQKSLLSSLFNDNDF